MIEQESRPSSIRLLRSLSLSGIVLSLLVPGLAMAQDDPDAAAAEAAAGVEAESPRFSALMSHDDLAPHLNDEEIEWQAEEDGRQFRIVRLVKKPGTFRFVAEDRVRFAGGASFEVVEQDESFFWVKSYRSFTKAERRVPAPVKKGPTEEQKTEIAKTYVPQTGEVNRLKLEPFDRGLPKRGQWRNGFDIADINADGHLDIIFGPVRKGRAQPNVFLGDSEGAWKPWREARYPQGPYDYGDVAVSDFNGDGHLDMAFGIHLRGMFLIVNDGNGTFQPWTEGIAFDIPGRGGDATSFSSRAIDVIDWDQDGKMDLIALGEGPKGRKGKGNMITGELINTSRGFGLYMNQGDGTWQPRGLETVPTPQANFGDDFAVGDFNGDGKKDLVTSTRRMGSLHILAIRDEEGGIEYQPLEELRPRAFVDTVDSADFDGDGRDDIAVGYRNRDAGPWRSGVDVYLQKETGWERRTLVSKETKRGFFGLANGDLNGDGNLDVVAVSGYAETFVFLGDGEGGFDAEATPELASLESPGCKAFEVRLRDLDGDQRDEIIAAFAGEQVGFPGMANLNKPGCPGLGSLRVWRTADVTSEVTPVEKKLETAQSE